MDFLPLSDSITSMSFQSSFSPAEVIQDENQQCQAQTLTSLTSMSHSAQNVPIAVIEELINQINSSWCNIYLYHFTSSDYMQNFY